MCVLDVCMTVLAMLAMKILVRVISAPSAASLAAGIGLLGLFYLWRWTSLLVGTSTNGEVASLGPERM